MDAKDSRSYLTAFSDAVLSISALWCVLIIQEKQYPVLFTITWPNNVNFTAASLGFGWIAVASFLGFIKFARLLPYQQEWIVRIHRYFSFLASCTGLPLLAAAYSLQTPYQSLHNAFLMLSIACPLLDLSGFIKREIIRESAGTLSIITILLISTVFSWAHFNINGIMGAVMFTFGGLVIGTDGDGFLIFKNVDLFHFVLAFGTISLGAGL